ncbi:stage II sporulation protein M [Bacillus zhangzhouensis]|uniref:stage II sporulation protein M n=1 Tax=Bacillus zhangzhouensis TaxID=1178540 RepID=UPI0006894870|nr:stage II sporulation protein M [Bacillus zhangzhouensis]
MRGKYKAINPFIKSFVLFASTLLVSLLIFYAVGVNLDSTEVLEFQNKNIFFYIVTNNLKVFLVIILGLFLYRIPTYITLMYNAVILAFALSALTHVLMFLSIIAHGIFEMLAFIIAGSVAFNKYEDVMSNKMKFIFISFVGILLILIAAVIETYISPIILKGMM